MSVSSLTFPDWLDPWISEAIGAIPFQAGLSSLDWASARPQEAFAAGFLALGLFLFLWWGLLLARRRLPGWALRSPGPFLFGLFRFVFLGAYFLAIALPGSFFLAYSGTLLFAPELAEPISPGPSSPPALDPSHDSSSAGPAEFAEPVADPPGAGAAAPPPKPSPASGSLPLPLLAPGEGRKMPFDSPPR